MNSEKYDLDMDNALTWSKDNKKIERAIMDRGYDKDTTMNVNYIRKQYTELDLTSCEIDQLDDGLLQFPNLTSLSVSQNNISILTNIPQSLEECIISQNILEFIDPNLSLPSLLYLNVSSNHLDSSHLGTALVTSLHLQVDAQSAGSRFLIQLRNLDFESASIPDISAVDKESVAARQPVHAAALLPVADIRGLQVAGLGGRRGRA